MKHQQKAAWAAPVLEEIEISETAGKTAGNQEAGGNNKRPLGGS